MTPDPRTLAPSDAADHQRRARTITVAYPPAAGSKTIRLRHLPCLSCRMAATSGCVRNGHLVGEAPDVLPPIRLELRSPRESETAEGGQSDG